MTTDYPIRIGERSRLFLRLAFGVRRDRAVVRLGEETVDIRFGRFNPRVPIARSSAGGSRGRGCGSRRSACG